MSKIVVSSFFAMGHPLGFGQELPGNCTTLPLPLVLDALCAGGNAAVGVAVERPKGRFGRLARYGETHFSYTNSPTTVAAAVTTKNHTRDSKEIPTRFLLPIFTSKGIMLVGLINAVAQRGHRIGVAG